MKIETFVQANGQEMDLTDLDKELKDKIKENGILLKNVDFAKVYVNMNDMQKYIVLMIDGKEVRI